LSEWLGWTQAILAAVTTVATVLLAVYAYGTIREMKRDRARITAENMLQNMFSPLCEILRRARTGNYYRHLARQKPPQPTYVLPRDYALEKREFERMQDLIEKFGFYLDKIQLTKLYKILDEYDTVEVPVPLPTGKFVTRKYYRFHNSDMDPFFDYVTNRRKELMTELQLTR